MQDERGKGEGMDFLLQNILIVQDDGYATVDVQVTDGRIAAIRTVENSSNGVQLSTPSAPIPSRNKLLLPGFVNGHTHSSQVWQRGGIPQLPLELWLADVADSTPDDLEQFYLAALSTAVDTVLSGGTCVMDHAYVVPNRELETIAALVKAYREAGIRAFIAPLIQDLPFVTGMPQGRSLPHQPYPRSTADILTLMETMVQEFHSPADGIYIAMGPTGFHRCSDALLVGCSELSDRYALCKHTHLLETRAQKMLAQERYGGSAVAHLQQIGFLDHRTSLAHGVWLTEPDMEIVATAGSTIVHNPVSNLRLGSGIAPVLKYLQAGVNVSFGCDGAASNDAQNLLEAIKLGTILHTVTDTDYHHWITPCDALKMAALGGAKGVNLAAETGEIALGKTADFVSYDLDHPSMLPATDPVQLLVLGRPTDIVDSVWVNGKRIVERGTMLTVDQAALYQELRDRASHLHRANYSPDHQPRFQMIHQIETHYRKVMNQFSI